MGMPNEVLIFGGETNQEHFLATFVIKDFCQSTIEIAVKLIARGEYAVTASAYGMDELILDEHRITTPHITQAAWLAVGFVCSKLDLGYFDTKKE